MNSFKKILLFTIISLITFLIINYGFTKYYYLKYTNNLNDYMSMVIANINREYPSVDEEEIIDVFTKNPIKGDSLLEKYGYKDVPILKSFSSIYKENLLLLGLFWLCLSLLFLSILIIENRIKNKTVKKIIKRLEDVNAGIYDLKLDDTEEGTLKILEDEIYKTTLMLREETESSIKAKNYLKDSLADISHQIKTPLTSIAIMVDNLANNDVKDQVRKEFLMDIQNQIEKLNFLIIALLKLSKFDANVIEFKKDEIDVAKLIEDSVKQVNALKNDAKVDIQVSGDKDVTFLGDYLWEREAITNIVKNCIEHTPPHKKIYITYSKTPFFTKIEIKDEGIGMTKEERRHIFERFYKGKNSNANSVGIGLSLAKEIIKKDNGDILVKSELGKGTTFVIKHY